MFCDQKVDVPSQTLSLAFEGFWCLIQRQAEILICQQHWNKCNLFDWATTQQHHQSMGFWFIPRQAHNRLQLPIQRLWLGTSQKIKTSQHHSQVAWATVETQIKRLQMSDSILKSILALWLLKVLSTDSTTDSFFLRTLQIKSNLMQLKMISWWHTFHFPRSETEVASEVGRKAPHSSSEGHGNTVDCAH